MTLSWGSFKSRVMIVSMEYDVLNQYSRNVQKARDSDVMIVHERQVP